MAEITISADASKATTFLNTFPRETSKAAFFALKRATKSAATLANRVVAKDMGLKVGAVRKRIKVIEPRGSNLIGMLRADPRRIPLIEFRAKGPEPSRGRGSGVTARIGGRSGRIRSAFISTMPSGRRGVFKRTGKRRLPIRELKGPSVGRVMDEHTREITARGQQVFETEFDRLLERILSGFGGQLA